MRTNKRSVSSKVTHEGAPAVPVSATKELRRTVMAHMLFEGTFYESGVDAAGRIADLVGRVPFADAAQIAIDARERMKLRHVPLLVVREMLRVHKGRQMGDLITRVIQRPDECGELLALYWKERADAPLAAQLKVGLARALKKFSEHQLAKYDRDAPVKLRDVLFLSHARSARVRKDGTRVEDEDRKALFARLASGQLATPDTWEVALSGGADKKATFERLLLEGRLGALALLRNLRGMLEAGVAEDAIRDGLARMNAERVLPFRFISAAAHAPRLEDALESAMFRCLEGTEQLPGKTALLIDHSGSMNGTKVSARSEIDRFEAATALAMLARETFERCRVFAFSDACKEVPARRGFALAQAIRESMPAGGTRLGAAVRHVYSEFPECDRLIVITDEQSADRPPQPQGRGYIVNVAGYKNGIAYGPWMSIDGWSEAILDYIRELEQVEGSTTA